MVEMAIVLPLLLLLLYGIISFGSIYLVNQSIKNAASDGARAALAGTTQAEETTLAVNQAENELSYLPVSVTPTVSFTCPAGTPVPTVGTCMTVTVTYPYGTNPLIPASGFFPFVPSTISATTVEVVNH